MDGERSARRERAMAIIVCRASGAERRRALPGDELVPHPMGVITRAITIDTPPDAVWPWIVQMGSGRAGWYAYDRIDNGGTPSARRIVPALQHVAVGEIMPWLPGARDGFVVQEVIAARALVLVVPRAPVARCASSAPRASWALVLEPLSAGRTRFIARSRIADDWLTGGTASATASHDPRIIERVYTLLAKMPRPLLLVTAGTGHYIMESRVLRGIRRRAERSAAATPATRRNRASSV
jgi:hypothetical protein